MKAILPRSSSESFLVHSSLVPSSPRISLSRNDSVSGRFPGDKIDSPRGLFHLEVNHRPIRRVFSESDMTGDLGRRFCHARSQSFAAVRIPEEEYVSDGDQVAFGGVGSLTLTERELDRHSKNGIQVEEFGLSGDGTGKGRMSGGGRGGNNFGTGGGNADRSKIGAYYQEMLKSDPSNSLVLRNYGKFLHEVEGDAVKAEECYGRAILASPGDGELLSLYGKLIWETQRDGDRALSYFNQAVHVSPDDCMVLGSYAQFMWEAEDDEDEETEIEVSPAAMVEAF